MKYLALICLLFAASCTKNKNPDSFKITLRLSHVFSPKEDLAISMETIAGNILKKTEGRVKILTYPQGQIATYKDGVEMVSRGAYFISVEDPSYIGDYVPEFSALVGPMLYRNFDEYTSLTSTPLVKSWVKKLEDNNIKVLSLNFIFGFRNLITNKVVKTPSDLKGLKVRTPGSQIFIKTINAMGASATPLPWGETFSALQQGVVDGLEGSEFTNWGTKVFETGKKNVAFTNHFLGVAGAYIALDVWNKIPKQYQNIISNEFTTESKNLIAKLKANHQNVINKLKEKGVSFNEVDRAQFESGTKKVFSDIPGLKKSTYNDITSELKKIRELSNEQ